MRASTVDSVVRSGTRPVDGPEARTVDADASWADAATADDRAIDRLSVRRPSPQNEFYRSHALGRRHDRLEPVHSLENRFVTATEAKRRATRRGSAAMGSPAEFFACFRSSRSSSPPRRRARCARRARGAHGALRSMRRAVDRAPTPSRPILALVSVALRADIITASKSSTAAA